MLGAALDVLGDVPYDTEVLLSDSRSALAELDRLNKAPTLARSVSHKAYTSSIQDWELPFQWILLHMGFDGNERLIFLPQKLIIGKS